MTENQIKGMVNKFLAWQLPKDFAPDGRITFNKEPDAVGNEITWPVGTNLLTAIQAEEMVRHMLEGNSSEICYVIEFRKEGESVEYFTAKADGFNWTNDFNTATHFSRHEDAVSVLRAMFASWPIEDRALLHAEEHMIL